MAQGAHVLEAPITGGMAALERGNMVVYLGGDKRVATAVTPMLEVAKGRREKGGGGGGAVGEMGEWWRGMC